MCDKNGGRGQRKPKKKRNKRRKGNNNNNNKKKKKKKKKKMKKTKQIGNHKRQSAIDQPAVDTKHDSRMSVRLQIDWNQRVHSSQNGGGATLMDETTWSTTDQSGTSDRNGHPIDDRQTSRTKRPPETRFKNIHELVPLQTHEAVVGRGTPPPSTFGFIISDFFSLSYVIKQLV